MILDYGTQLSYSPIRLDIGTIRKPTLRDIDEIGFNVFDIYQFFLRLTPNTYYSKICLDEQEKEYWNKLDDEEKEKITIHDIIAADEQVKNTYIKLLNFFFIENVIYYDNMFVITINKDIDEELKVDDIIGVLNHESFEEVLDLLQQICCINNKKKEAESKPKFKNKLAEKLFQKIKKAEEEERQKKKVDLNLSIPNIISSVCSKHPSINLINVWDLTVFQLLDKFNRLQINSIYDIDSLRISVWGDEKKTFDPALWYKNNFDK